MNRDNDNDNKNKAILNFFRNLTHIAGFLSTVKFFFTFLPPCSISTSFLNSSFKRVSSTFAASMNKTTWVQKRLKLVRKP